MRPDLLNELERLIERDWRAGTLRLSRPGMINRKHYYLLAGMKSARSGPYAGGVFERYERLLAAGAHTQWELRREETCRRLENAVTEDHGAGTLVRDRNGRISREHYTAVISVNRVMASRYLKDTFTKLDAIVGRVSRPQAQKPRRRRRATPRPAASPGAAASQGDPRRRSGAPTARTLAAKPKAAARAAEAKPRPGLGRAKADNDEPPSDGEGKRATRAPRSRGSLYFSRREELRRILTSDLDAGSVRMSRGGKISRTHYAALVGFNKGSLRFTLLDIFQEFEKRLGNPRRIHDLRLPEMRKYLERELEAGRLGLRGRRIDRSGFMRHFGFKGGSLLTQYPAVRAMFEEFDERVRQTGYVPSAVQDKLDELDAVLSGSPPLNKTGQAIDRTQVALRIGVPVHRMSVGAYATRLAEADRRQRERLVQDGRVVLLHGRKFDFVVLATLWPEPTILAIASHFSKLESAQTPGHAKTAYEATVKLFRDVANYWVKKAGNVPFTPRDLDAEEWDEAIRATATAIRSAIDLAPRTKHVRIQALNRVAAIYARAGVIPDVARVRGIKNAEKLGGRLPSLAEAALAERAVTTEGRLDDYVSFAARTVKEAALRRSLDMEDDEVDAFAVSVGREVAQDPTVAGLSIPQACLRIIDRRLETLGRLAITVVDEARSLMKRGEELLAASTFDAAEFSANYSAASNKHHRGLAMRSAFPFSDDGSTVAIGNLLAFVKHLYSGRMPTTGPGRPDDGFGEFFARRYHELGGRPFLDAHLNPSTRTVTAVLTLNLLESGSNVEVGRIEPKDPFQPSDLKGHVAVRGAKARAKSKPIVADLEKGSPAVLAMTWLATATERRRARSPDAVRDTLFLVDGVGGVGQRITEATYRANFKALAAGDRELSKLDLTPNMIRPSVLLKSAIENDGRIQPGAVLGQHGEEVSKRYQQRAPTRLMYDQENRTFGLDFEALVADRLSRPHVVLGLSVEEWEQRIERVRRTGKTGLGTFCMGVDGERKTSEGNCGRLDCWNECPSMLLIAEVGAIADLQIWQSSLRAAEGDWIRDRLERWAQVWLPWLQFCNVVEEKLSRGAGLAVWEEATARRMYFEAEASFIPPQPW